MASVAELAIKLNNEAAHFVSSGNLLRASQTLCAAADVLCLWCGQKGQNDMQGSVFTAHNMAAEPSAAPKHAGYNPPGMMHIQDRLLCLSNDLTFLAHRNGCLLRVMSTVILFNSALVQHLVARVMGCDAALVRAMALYERVLYTCCPWPIQSLLQCLVLNNLADVQNELCDHGQCKHYLETLARVAQTTRCLEDCALVSDEEVQGMNLNYVLAQFPTAASSA